MDRPSDYGGSDVKQVDVQDILSREAGLINTGRGVMSSGETRKAR